MTFFRLFDTRLPLQKLLFSATLTENPEKLERLKLCEPRLFTSIVKEDVNGDISGQTHFAGKYTTPSGLQVTVCNVYIVVYSA